MHTESLLLNMTTSTTKNYGDSPALILILTVGILVGFIAGFSFGKHTNNAAKTNKNKEIQHNKTIDTTQQTTAQDEETLNPYFFQTLLNIDECTANPYAEIDDAETENPYFSGPLLDEGEATLNPYTGKNEIRYTPACVNEELTSDPYRYKPDLYAQTAFHHAPEEEETINPYSIDWYMNRDDNQE